MDSSFISSVSEMSTTTPPGACRDSSELNPSGYHICLLMVCTGRWSNSGVPLCQAGVEHGRISDLHRLPVVGGGGRCAAGDSQYQPGPIAAKLLRQRNAGFIAVEQLAIRQVELLPHMHA